MKIKILPVLFIVFLGSCGTVEVEEPELNVPSEEFNLVEDTIVSETYTAPLIAEVDTNIEHTANEQAGIDEILKTYAGKCVTKKGVQTEGKVTGKYFEMEVSESTILEEFKVAPEIASALIAWKFYNALKEEAKEIDFIKTSIHYKGIDKSTIDFSISDLELVARKVEVIEKWVKLVGDHKYEEVKAMMSDEVFAYPIDEFVGNMDKWAESGGDAEGIKMYSFKFFELSENKGGESDDPNNQRLVHISFTMLRSKQSHQCSAEFIADEKNDLLMNVKYIY